MLRTVAHVPLTGYTLTFKMPTMDLSESDECSISIKDQRNWGGCVDFKLVEPVVTRAPRPTVPPRVLEVGLISPPTGADKATFSSLRCQAATLCLSALSTWMVAAASMEVLL